MRRVSLIALCLVFTGMFSAHAFNIWSASIAKFEAEDKANPPAKGGILFVGSSSIVLWDLKKAFPDVPALNRGFGGSQVSDVNFFFDRVVTPYAPKTIVFYSGDNDLAVGGKKSEQVIADYQEFFAKVRAALPEAKIINVAIKPSVKRWHLFDVQKQVNAAVAEALKADKNAVFIDCVPAMLGADGKPDPKYLRDDGLHMNDTGYAVWNELLRPHL